MGQTAKNWRRYLFLLVFFMLAAIIIGRLFYLQILNHKLYQSWALGQQVGFEEVQGTRGEIFFENSKENRGNYGAGELKSLAINKDVWLVAAVPKKIKDKNNFADLISKSIMVPKESIHAKLESSPSYTVIKKDL